MRVPLTQGAYTARSVIANAQRAVNLFAEKNPPNSETPFTHYNVPGLTLLATPPTAGAARSLYWANSDQLYYVCGNTVYAVGPPPNWTLTSLGTITTNSNPVSMADNGTSLVLVDGSPNGYEIDLATQIMIAISETGNSPPMPQVYAFYGADRVDIIDGFMLFNSPGTQSFYSTYDNEIIFDATWFAEKNGYSDKLVSVIVSRRTIWLIGERTTEIWFDAGSAGFPFQIMPGPFIQHGCIAKYSVAQVDGAVFWLSQDQAGTNVIVRGEGFEVKPISTAAMENEFASYPTIADAVGFCFTMNGHTFYQLNFPTANKTWRWDERTPGLWHEALYIDANGNENRHRAQCAAWAYGFNVCADWETGLLYAFDLDNVTDNGMPMAFRRGYPHMMQDGRRVIYPGFTLDVEAATSPNTRTVVGPFPIFEDQQPPLQPIDAGPPAESLFAGPAPAGLNNQPLVYLRWSDTRGKTWSQPVAQTLGATGNYDAQPHWARNGMARDRVYEVYGTIWGKIAISGAFLDPSPIPLAS